MTVFKQPRGKTYRYDFYFDGQRHSGNTKQVTLADAQRAEREIQLRLRRVAAGIADFTPAHTPRFQEWTGVFLLYKRGRISRPDHVEHVTRVLLRFWGAAPSDPAKVVAGEPYLNLRLGDPIARPELLLEFEAWMQRRGIGAQSRNHYRGMLRRMYALALRPEYRKVVGLTLNPFVGVESDPTYPRTVALSEADVRRWLSAASYHVRLAIGVAALAPKLRLSNILALRWSEHFAPDPRTTKFNPRVAHYIRVSAHKTARRIGRPLVSPINAQLLRILKDAWTRHPMSDIVVAYRGQPVKSIRGGVKAAAEAVGLPYGRDTADGATFHTLRHTAATLLSAVEADPLKLRDALGHTDLATTLDYRHMTPTQERPSLERLSRTLKIADLVMASGSRASRKTRAS